MIWNDGGDRADLRWVGTEAGYVCETNWSLLNATGDVTKHSIFDIKNLKGTECHQFNTTRIFDGGNKQFKLEVYIKGKEDMMINMALNDE